MCEFLSVEAEVSESSLSDTDTSQARVLNDCESSDTEESDGNDSYESEFIDDKPTLDEDVHKYEPELGFGLPHTLKKLKKTTLLWQKVLMADAVLEKAVDAVYAKRGRPSKKPNPTKDAVLKELAKSRTKVGAGKKKTTPPKQVEPEDLNVDYSDDAELLAAEDPQTLPSDDKEYREGTFDFAVETMMQKCYDFGKRKMMRSLRRDMYVMIEMCLICSNFIISVDEEDEILPPAKKPRKVTIEVPDENEENEDDEDDDDDDDEDDEGDDVESIQKKVQELEEKRNAKKIKCGICDVDCLVGLREKDDQPYILCKGNCKFAYMDIKKACEVHTQARQLLDKKFRPQLGGKLPRCPRHNNIATLMRVDKATDEGTKSIAGHLFFICTNPAKEGGPCMTAGGRWCLVADVDGESPKQVKKKRELEKMYRVDLVLKAQRVEKAANLVGNMMDEAELDMQHGTGFFANE